MKVLFELCSGSFPALFEQLNPENRIPNNFDSSLRQLDALVSAKRFLLVSSTKAQMQPLGSPGALCGQK